jgi:hypothetical protein
MSCSLLTPWICSFNCPSCGDVICGISYLYSFSYFSYVICGIAVICLTAYTVVGTTNGSSLPFIIFHALKFVLSYSFFTPEPEAPPSSILFFLLKALLGESTMAFFLFSNVVYISFLVFKTLVSGFCGLSFWCTNIYWKIFANTKANWWVSFLFPLFSLTYSYHLCSSLHRLLNIICAEFTFYPSLFSLM